MGFVFQSPINKLLRANFPERAFFYFPTKVGAHRAVDLRAVDGEFFTADVGEAVLRARCKMDCAAWIKVGGGGDAVQSGEVAGGSRWR